MSLIVSDVTTGVEPTITMSRTFPAPRALVWECITQPRRIEQWWGPRRLSTRVEQSDLRPGGAWRFVQTSPDGDEFAFRGEYLEVVPPERLVLTFEFEPMPGHIVTQTLTLEERDGKTTFTDVSRFQTVEDRDGMLASGMEGGANESFDRLGELLASLQ